MEHTNYYWAARLEDYGYKLHHSYIVGERYINEGAVSPDQNRSKETGTPKAILREETGENVTEKIVTDNGSVVGIKRQELLYLPKGKLPYGVGLDDIFQFAYGNHISRILVNIPENEKLLAHYRESGIHKAYLYRCYQKPEVFGADVYDRTGNEHLGIIEFPVPILKGNADIIKTIREKLYEPDFSDLTVVDFSDLAQGCKTYDEFIEKMKEVSEIDLNYFGIAICGTKKKVNKLTGSMALLR